MVYVLYGKEPYLIKKEVQKIMQEKKIEEIDCSQYNATETPLKEIIEDAKTVSLFHPQKMILAENAYLFTGNQKKATIEQDTQILIDYLNSKKIKYNKIFSERPTLNDVFLELTGKELRD